MQVVLTRTEKRNGCCLVLFVLLQILTYVLLAHARLAARIVGSIQEAPSGFVLLDGPTQDQAGPLLTRAIEDELGTRGFTVYHRLEEIPAKNRIYQDMPDGERLVVAYKDGWQMVLCLKTLFPGVVSANYGSHTGPEGVWGTSGVFVWFLCTWVCVWRGGTYMA